MATDGALGSLSYLSLIYQSVTLLTAGDWNWVIPGSFLPVPLYNSLILVASSNPPPTAPCPCSACTDGGSGSGAEGTIPFLPCWPCCFG